MQKSDVSFHSFIIAPKSFERIYSEKICHTHYQEERENGAQYPGKFGPVCLISHRQRQIASKNDFNNNPENKGLASDKREEKRRRNNKRHKRHRKNPSQYDVFKLIVGHGYQYSKNENEIKRWKKLFPSSIIPK